MPFTTPRKSDRCAVGNFVISQAARLYQIARLRVVPNPPSISLNAVENHSGGAFNEAPNLTVPDPPSIALAVPTPSVDALGGAIAHDESPLTDNDETAAGNNATANDMHLSGPSASPATTDGFTFGYASVFDGLCINVGTAGAGTYSITWKYWSGSAWSNLTTYFDTTNHFKTAGKVNIAWTRPADWALLNIGGLNLYWVKAEITSFTNMTTKPLGTQAWIDLLT